MRQQASQKLACAFRLDEIACSVVIMQGATTLENVASMVLRRNADDNDAKYVHFFQEKIPSRQVAESTDLAVLSELVDNGVQSQPEILRTRAAVKIFKGDYYDAVQDYTAALASCRFGNGNHQQCGSSDVHHKLKRDVVLSQDQQPSSLGMQLLFDRASVYLALAIEQVKHALNPVDRTSQSDEQSEEYGIKRDHARKLVKLYAKSGIRDLLAFFSDLDYSPDLPVKTAMEFYQRIATAMKTFKVAKYSYTGPVSHRVHPLSKLFDPVPPENLPAWPQDTDSPPQPQPPQCTRTCESVTFYPLLIESLNMFLLCHALAQTSSKELQRHAYMASRIARIANGYPVLQPSQSPSQEDFAAVLKQTDNWLGLCSSWHQLCTFAPSPLLDEFGFNTSFSKATPKQIASAASVTRNPSLKDTKDAKSLQQPLSENSNTPRRPGLRGFQAEREPFLRGRPPHIIRWILEAPRVTGTAKRKKRSKKPAVATVVHKGVAGTVDTINSLELAD